MRPAALKILRIGMAITFLWIGVSIFQDPEAWGGFIQPWVKNFLLIPIKQAMIATAILDMTIGILLGTGIFVWFAALIGAFHLMVVLIVSGINIITIRDIGLLAAMLAIAANVWPDQFRFKKGRESGDVKLI